MRLRRGGLLAPWAVGSAQGSREVECGVQNQRNEAGRRHRRKRGAGGRPRCVWWPRCTLCGCAALRSTHLTSRQTMTRRTLGNKARVDLLLSFSTADAVDICSELIRVVRPEADRLVGPVVALAEQNAIDLAPVVVASSHTPSKSRSEAFLAAAPKGPGLLVS